MTVHFPKVWSRWRRTKTFCDVAGWRGRQLCDYSWYTCNRPPRRSLALPHLPVKRISNHRKGRNVTAAKQAASYAWCKESVSASVMRTTLSRIIDKPRIQDRHQPSHQPTSQSVPCTTLVTSRPPRQLFQNSTPISLRCQLEVCKQRARKRQDAT